MERLHEESFTLLQHRKLSNRRPAGVWELFDLRRTKFDRRVLVVAIQDLRVGPRRPNVRRAAAGLPLNPVNHTPDRDFC